MSGCRQSASRSTGVRPGSPPCPTGLRAVGPADVTELEELARDAGRADSGATSETVVARLDPATRISEGDNAQMWADARSLHVFDPATGRNLSVAAGTKASAAGQAGAGTAGHGAATPSTGQPTSGQTRSSTASQ